MSEAAKQEAVQPKQETNQAEHSMKGLKIEKLVINCGCGTDHVRLEKSIKLLEKMTGKKPVKTITQMRVATWGLRKGLPVGAKITLRGQDAIDMAKRLLEAKEFMLKENNFDISGTISFGIQECIDIPGVEYEPEIGIIGLETTITLARPGFRVKRRRYLNRKLPHRHQINKEEAIAYMQKNFGVKFPEEVEE